MSAEKLTEAANKHLYAGDVLQEAAKQITVAMEHMTDAQLETAVQCRAIVVNLAQSELMVTSGLVDAVQQEASKC